MGFTFANERFQVSVQTEIRRYILLHLIACLFAQCKAFFPLGRINNKLFFVKEY